MKNEAKETALNDIFNNDPYNLLNKPLTFEQKQFIKKHELLDKQIFLESKGFFCTIPAGANYICVMGANGKYFKVKNKAANTITANLNSFKNIIAWNTQSQDGFYDFFAK